MCGCRSGGAKGGSGKVKPWLQRQTLSHRSAMPSFQRHFKLLSQQECCVEAGWKPSIVAGRLSIMALVKEASDSSCLKAKHSVRRTVCLPLAGAIQDMAPELNSRRSKKGVAVEQVKLLHFNRGNNGGKVAVAPTRSGEMKVDRCLKMDKTSM